MGELATISPIPITTWGTTLSTNVSHSTAAHAETIQPMERPVSGETRPHPATVQGLSTASPSQTASTPRETSLVSGFTPGTPTGIKEAMEKPLSPKTASDPKPHGEITYTLSSTTALSTAMMVLLPYLTLLFFECLGYGFNPETAVGSRKSV